MERAILPSVLGLPGYAAIGIALGFTGLGVFIDLERINGLGTVFKGCYFLGCVLAVCWVKRRALFGPMVQPPLLLALAVPGVVLVSGDVGSRGGKAAQLLAIATPLLNGFPTMAVTAAFVLVIGIIRYRVQRPTHEPEPVRAARPVPLRDEDDPERAARAERDEPAGDPEPDRPSLAARLERKERAQGSEPAEPGRDEPTGARSEARPEQPARSSDGTREQPNRKPGGGAPPETDAERTEQQERQPAEPPRELRPQQGQPRQPDRRPPPGQRPADQRLGPNGEDDDEPTSLLPVTEDAVEPVGAQPGRPPAGKPPAGRTTPPGRPRQP